MRRIYESGALRRDDDEPFSPADGESGKPQAFRSIPGTVLSRLLLIDRLRDWAISIDVSVPDTEFPVGASVPFRVTVRNAFPLPVTVSTQTPVLWTWSVDGIPEASHVPLQVPPTESRGFRFGRGERKRFTRRWNGMFRVSDSEWEPADPGAYTIGVGLNVENPLERGLYDETTVRIVPPSNY